MPPLFNSYQLYEKPFVIVSAQGQVAPDIGDRIISFKWTDKLKKVDSIDLEVSDPSGKFFDDPRFKPEAVWKFRWGYSKDLSRERTMTLKYYTPNYDESGIISMSMVFLGRGHDLVRVKSGRNWGRVQTSDIAKKIAKRHGLKVHTTPSNDVVESPYVQSATTTDFAYLTELAEDIDFEFFVDNETLVYRARDEAYSENPRARFVWGGPNSIIKSFKPTVKASKVANVKVNAVGKTGKATTASVDSLNVGGVHLADEIIASSNKADPRVAVTSGSEARARVDAAATRSKPVSQEIREFGIDVEDGSTKWMTRFEPAVTDAAAEQISSPETNKSKLERKAKARVRHFLDQSVEAAAEFIGTPILCAKATFVFVLPDRRLSGSWYISEATHSINSSGYTVSASLKRGAINDKSNRKANNRTSNGQAPVVAGAAGATAATASQPVTKINQENGRIERSVTL